MNIYLAGRFSTGPRLRVIRTQLENLGHVVTSTWLDEPSSLSFEKLTDKERRSFAARDLFDIGQSQVLALDLLRAPSRGGCEVEFGFALSSPRYKTTYIVGAPRNIFHFLAAKTFDSWEELICHVKKQTL